jgi:hypothetical protein
MRKMQITRSCGTNTGSFHFSTCHQVALTLCAKTVSLPSCFILFFAIMHWEDGNAAETWSIWDLVALKAFLMPHVFECIPGPGLFGTWHVQNPLHFMWYSNRILFC